MKRMLLLLLLLAGRAGAEDYATRMLEATFKLFNKDSTATGFFVTEAAPEGEKPAVFLATANHVLAKMSGETGVVVLRIPGGDGSYTRRDLPSRSARRENSSGSPTPRKMWRCCGWNSLPMRR